MRTPIYLLILFLGIPVISRPQSNSTKNPFFTRECGGSLNTHKSDIELSLNSSPDSLSLDELIDSSIFIANESPNTGVCGHIVLDDSLLTIMKHAHRILCILESLNPCDTIRTHSQKIVPTKHYEVVRFIINDPTNYLTNDIVFCQFHPDVSFFFSESRKKNVYLQLDFGLKKWRLLNSQKEEICTADMKNSAYYFMLITRELFPGDITLGLLYDCLKPY